MKSRKRLTVLGALLGAVLFAAMVYGWVVVNTGKQEANALIYAGACELVYVKLVEGGADATLTLYDSSSATSSGKTVRDYWSAVIGDGATGAVFGLNNGIVFTQGIYAEVSGTSAQFYLGYVPKW
jgi:hypothetical protein